MIGLFRRRMRRGAMPCVMRLAGELDCEALDFRGGVKRRATSTLLNTHNGAH